MTVVTSYQNLDQGIIQGILRYQRGDILPDEGRDGIRHGQQGDIRAQLAIEYWRILLLFKSL